MNTNKKRSVCFICYRKFPDTNFENYSHFVSENDYNVTVVAFKDVGQEGFEIIGNKEVYRVSLPQTQSKRVKWVVFMAWVVKFLRRNTFSIVHVHNTCPYFLLYKVFGNNRSKFVYHNTSYPVSTSRLRAYRTMISDFLQAIVMDRLIIQSEELKEKMLGMGKLKKTTVVPIGFNPRLFPSARTEEKNQLRKRLGFRDSVKMLVYVGTMQPIRELYHLIEAFALICKAHHDARLLMVGDGDARMELTALSENLKIDNSVVFTGVVPHEEVVNYIKASDIGISYIPINENYTYNPPLKTIEYLASGLPVVATNTVSNRAIIEDQENGILVQDNAQDISKIVIDLLNDDKKLAQLTQNARKSIEPYDIEKITQTHLLPIYNDILR